jgi:hypothetical protein
MSETPPRVNWRQFSLSSVLLIMAVVAAFLAGRGSAHREMMSEIATLRGEIAGKKSLPQPLQRMRSKEVTCFAGVARVGPLSDQSTETNGSARFIMLPAGKLQRSQRIPGRNGYFYFKAGGEGDEDAPVWEFAWSSSRDSVEKYDGRSLNARFYGAGSSALRASGVAFPVTIGQVWLARPVDKPETIYAIKLVRQEEHEAMSVQWAQLFDESPKK